MTEPRSPQTRDRILDIAERLFAERGVDATSVRQITKTAKVNLAAINYHFGGKKGLIAAVVERRIAPVSSRQLEGLKTATRAVKERSPSLEVVLEAFFRPAIEQALDPRSRSASFGRLMARCMVDPNPVVAQKIREGLEPVMRQLRVVLPKALPELTREDMFWRMHLLIGGLNHSLLMMALCKGRRRRFMQVNPEMYVRRFLAFAVAVFKVRLA